MPANQFNCPSCNTLLRLAEPLPPGTKVKCPKCTTIFSAEETPAAVLPARAVSDQFAAGDSPPRLPARPQFSADVDDRQFEEVDDEPYRERDKLSRLPRREYRIDSGAWFHHASAHFSHVVGPMIGYFFITMGIGMVLGFIPILGPLANIIIQPALTAGYFVVALAQLKGKKWEFGNFFNGFQSIWPLLGNALLSFLLVFACMIPGGVLLGISIAIGAAAKAPPFIILGVIALIANFVVAMVYVGAPLQMFCVPLILDRKLGPVEAMQGAWMLSKGHTWGIFGMLFLLGLINAAGALMCFFGLLFAFPFTILAQTAGYLIIAGKKSPVEPSGYPHETDYGLDGNGER